jgi:hypothetical protein
MPKVIFTALIFASLLLVSIFIDNQHPEFVHRLISEFEIRIDHQAPIDRESPKKVQAQNTVTESRQTSRSDTDSHQLNNLKSIEGWVGNPSGSGLSDIVIKLESLGFDGEEPAIWTVSTDHRGDFTLQDLVPQRQYKLEIDASQQHAGATISSFTTGTADLLKSIILKEITMVRIDGMIVDSDLAPIADIALEVRHLSIEFPDRIIRSDSSGYFNLDSYPAGEVRIYSRSTDGFRIKGLELNPDEYRTVTLILDKGSNHLSGVVTNNLGTLMAGIQVILKSGFATDNYHSYSYRTATTNQGGTFDFSNLANHMVTVGVYAAGYEDHIQRHNFSSTFDRINIVLTKK